MTEDDEKPPSTLASVSVKRELEDDFPSIETDSKLLLKPSSCTSGDYDEWLEIQKELGVYPSVGSDSSKSRNMGVAAVSGSGSGSVAGSVSGSSSRSSSKAERTRANGECRLSGAAAAAAAAVVAAAATSASSVPGANVQKNPYEQDSSSLDAERRWSSATDLERDLLEDADSLDGLALQTQCPSTINLGSNESVSVNDHDDINAQVQSAIDSILNLKKRPSTAAPAGAPTGNPPPQQTSESKDTVLDQAVRSILGS